MRPQGEPSAEREPLGGGTAEAVAARAVPLSTTVEPDGGTFPLRKRMNGAPRIMGAPGALYLGWVRLRIFSAVAGVNVTVLSPADRFAGTSHSNAPAGLTTRAKK